MAKTLYEMVIGLEVHVELDTKTKIFCGCSTAFGAAPNTQTCPVCMGLPGSLPVLNKKVVDYAIKAGLATNCSITRKGKQDRKNYFYPDLAKAYQVSQYDLPLCEGGHIDIEEEDNNYQIGITRIHIEEDAGKLNHIDGGSLIDYNRAGVPLIEIVSEPDIRSATQAKAYLQKLRAIIMYAGLSDCKMNEGSFRCDVNLSVREVGFNTLGTRTEMKNLNSFSFIGKAIESEFKRQIEVIESGDAVIQETRRWDNELGKSFSMRTKEDAHDYRYFPDPDLAPIIVSEQKINEIRSSLEMLPDERKKLYMDNYALTAYEADKLVSEKYIADFYEKAAAKGSAKLIANLMMSEVFRLLAKEDGLEQIPFEPEKLGILAKRIEEEIISQSMAKKIVDKLWTNNIDVDEMIEKDDLRQITDITYLTSLATKIIEGNSDIVASYKAGKDKAFQALIGIIMRQTKGKASPSISAKIMSELIDEIDA